MEHTDEYILHSVYFTNMDQKIETLKYLSVLQILLVSFYLNSYNHMDERV